MWSDDHLYNFLVVWGQLQLVVPWLDAELIGTANTIKVISMNFTMDIIMNFIMDIIMNLSMDIIMNQQTSMDMQHVK